MKIFLFVLILIGNFIYSQEPLRFKISKETCEAALLKRSGGNITKSELQKCDSLFLKGDCDLKIVSYQVTCCYPGHLKEIIAFDVRFTSEIKSNFSKLDIGYRFFIEEIKVMDKNGLVYKLPDLTYKITQFP